MTEEQKAEIARCKADILSARHSKIHPTDEVIHIGMREKYAEACIIAAFDQADSHCRKCGGEMRQGIATGQTFTAGGPDFPGDTHAVTFSAGGPGAVIECMKCADCGWSVTAEVRKAVGE